MKFRSFNVLKNRTGNCNSCNLFSTTELSSGGGNLLNDAFYISEPKLHTSKDSFPKEKIDLIDDR